MTDEAGAEDAAEEGLLVVVAPALVGEDAAGVDAAVARGAVDCPAIWESTSAEKTPVILSRL